MPHDVRWVVRNGEQLLQVSFADNPTIMIDTETAWQLIHDLRWKLLVGHPEPSSD